MVQQTQSYDEWIDRVAIDSNGDKIGTIKDVLYDDVTGRPEWVTVKTGLLGRQSIAPIAGATFERRDDGDMVMRLPTTKDRIKEAPDFDTDGYLTQDEERELYAHYGFMHGERTAEASYGKNYATVSRPDTGYQRHRWDRDSNEWRENTERATATTQEVPVEATVPIEATVRLRRYQTQKQRTETRTVQVPVTETEEHVEVADVDAEAKTRRT